MIIFEYVISYVDVERYATEVMKVLFSLPNLGISIFKMRYRKLLNMLKRILGLKTFD